ncbi:hypothetical protein BaRGS_00030521 [Batillaria attramentaria]|uniref:Uncharacterized protein n=1 Tax=Batillaria attramentaria TaxID=370345 RepID=A0ABD0JTN5_9CAEN
MVLPSGPSPSERWAWSQTWFRQETCRSQRDSLGHRRGSAVRLVTLKEVGVLADTVLPSGLPPSVRGQKHVPTNRPVALKEIGVVADVVLCHSQRNRRGHRHG